MFRHNGNRRTFLHNLRLACVLSFIAGIVNIAGVLSVATLTTNVTGHFAFFAEEIALNNYAKATTIAIFILFFLLGAFVSNLMVELALMKNQRIAHAFPMFLEVLLLAFVGSSLSLHPNYSAYILLFSMGLQNAMVTKISQSTVRTTHLTGLFTDLGIELSQLFFYKKPAGYTRLKRNISLRLSIIVFFFLGGVLGGLFYKPYGLKILLFAAFTLFIALVFDNAKLVYHLARRKIKSNSKNDVR